VRVGRGESSASDIGSRTHTRVGLTHRSGPIVGADLDVDPDLDRWVDVDLGVDVDPHLNVAQTESTGE